MERICKVVKSYTADEEEPSCINCCFCAGEGDGTECDFCGPEYGWYNYLRLDVEDADERA